jgi:hypothetical protein
LSGFEAISKETILARNEVVEGGTITKKTELVLAETELNNTTLK